MTTFDAVAVAAALIVIVVLLTTDTMVEPAGMPDPSMPLPTSLARKLALLERTVVEPLVVMPSPARRGRRIASSAIRMPPSAAANVDTRDFVTADERSAADAYVAMPTATAPNATTITIAIARMLPWSRVVVRFCRSLIPPSRLTRSPTSSRALRGGCASSQ
jgi:hypothetical protein